MRCWGKRVGGSPRCNVSIVFCWIGGEILDDVLFEVVDELEIELDVFVVVEGEGRNQVVEVLDEVAEDRYLGLFLNQGN